MALEARDGVGANLAELVHTGEPADDGPVAHLNVAGQCGVVGQDGLVAQLHIVRQVHVGHDPVVVTHARDAAVLRGAAVEGAELADGVAVADVQLGGLAGVLLVLRRSTQRSVRVDLIVGADGRWPIDHAVRANARSAAHLHARSNHGVRAHADLGCQLGARVHDGRGVDQGHRFKSPCAWCTSTRLPPPFGRPHCPACGSGRCRPCGGRSRIPRSAGLQGQPAA